ncbi:MAG: hypothetical protein ACRERU_17375 [Methylococcales bacterium]
MLIPVVCGSFALIVCLSFWLRRRRDAVPIHVANAENSTPFGSGGQCR